MLVLGSFLVFPVLLFIHPPAGQMIQDMMVPKMPRGAALNEVMLLIIAIVGTTVAPWQLFFQQSYVVDKRIRPRFIKYERVDLMVGIAIVIAGAMAIMAFTAQTFAGHPEFGNFVDAGAVSAGMEKYFGKAPAIFFALALLDACIIGASAVSLATAYALGDVFSWRHSLHRKPTEAKGFYAIYCGLIVLAAVLVLTPGIQLGLLTSAVQTLAGVLLPGATVFLLLLCNDKPVLGPWVNSRRLNLFTGGVVAVLVMLSVILTGSVLYPGISDTVILSILIGGSVIGLVAALGVSFMQRRLRRPDAENIGSIFRAANVANDKWRMPPLDQLPPARLSTCLSHLDDCVARLSHHRRQPCSVPHFPACDVGRVIRASIASARRWGAIGVFRLASSILRCAMILYRQRRISRRGLQTVLSATRLLERLGALLALGRRFRKRQEVEKDFHSERPS